jgi:MFS family permease
VRDIEARVQRSTGERLENPDGSKEMTSRQRKSLGFITIAKTVATLYPKRTVLGLSLFIGHLTVSEVFPMETRALAIAFFYAIGTAAGGIAGPLLFAKLVGTGDEGQVALGFALGAVLMIAGGIVELFYGVKAERQSLEDIAKPLTADDAGAGGGRQPAVAGA